MSKPELLDCYDDVFSSALKAAPKHHGGPRPLNQIVAKQAAALIAQQAASPAFDGGGNGPPAQPIATTRA